MAKLGRFVWLLAVAVLSLPAVAQRSRIEGRVLDERTHESVIGAEVSLSSGKAGTITDADGKFRIEVPSLPATLLVSYIGYKTLDVAVYEYTEPITIELSENLRLLDEVVVIGYGTQKRKELTGAITTVQKEQLQQVSTSFDNLLGGAVSGLNVTQSSGQPGAAFNIRIRGGNSVTGGNEPLYVVDGVIIYEDGGSSSTSAGVSRIADRLNPLAAINPGDIESIEVLKDVSATAIYGSRGSNGVIIITTKSGKKGKNNIEYQYSAGWQQVSKKLDLLNASEWAKVNQEIYPVTDLDKGQYYGWSQAQLDDLGEGTDWQGAALRTSPTQTHQLTVSGGDEKTRYLLSGNFNNQDGIILNTDFQRYTGRFNFERDLFSNFTVGLTANAGKLAQNGLADYAGIETGGASNSLNYVIIIPQTVPIRNLDGTFNYNNIHEKGDLRYGERTVNAISDLENTVSKNITNTLVGNIYAKYAILPSLTARVSASTNLSNSTQNFFGPSSSAAGFLSKGYGTVGNKRTDSWQYEYTLNYAKQLNRAHYIDVLAGYSTQTTSVERTTSSTTKFSNESLGYHNLQASEGLLAPVTAGSESVLNSVLGRVNYTLQGRYNLTATLRADGSSRFASGHKWGYFPSVGLSWNANEEAFLKDIKAINNLKVRASLGTVGNQEIGDYRYEDTYSTRKYSFNNKIVIGYVQANRSNPELKWETTSQYNAGIDLSLFDYRLGFVADAYYKKTSDLLLNIPVEVTTGYTSQLKNVGNITNKGVEFELKGSIIEGKDLSWNVSANIAKNINEVTNVALGSGYIIQGSTILKVGEAYGSFYGLVFDGIVQKTDDISKVPVPSRNLENNTSVQPGDIRYKDQNSDNRIDLDHDRVVLGSPQPDFIYGFSTTLRYKSLSLFAAFQGSQGNELYNSLRRRLETPDPSYNLSTALLDRWTDSNPSKTIPRAVIAAVSDLDSRYIEDASFLKLKVLSLSYLLPISIKQAPTTKFKVFTSAQNLLTLTKYKGYDPEVAGGTDGGVYPTSKTFTFGVNISY
ncbi:Outer membrane cobalamin receptor protein, SusC/RagA family [Bacteroidales bacterium Barb6XT]|nr:Outer membrane cobalamin receptor protein, SusC/RagA family [Bacteroidales bacterium Barb6XT]